MLFTISITIIVFILLAIMTQSTSNYNGVSWDEKRKLWKAEFYCNGNKIKSYFQNEIEATRKINQFSESIRLPSTNPEVPEILNQEAKENTSQYEEVCLHKNNRKWNARLYLKDQTQKYEIDAAKRLNEICEEMGIPLRNPVTSITPIQQHQKTEKISQYNGVYWNKEIQKWYAMLSLISKKQYGGVFNDETHAAKRVNEMCKENGILPQNPGISVTPSQQYRKREKTSQYKGVYWHEQTCKWYAHLCLNTGEHKYGGIFDYELDAAKKVNHICEELGIAPRNPGISRIYNFSLFSLPEINPKCKYPRQTPTKQILLQKNINSVNPSENSKN